MYYLNSVCMCLCPCRRSGVDVYHNATIDKTAFVATLLIFVVEPVVQPLLLLVLSWRVELAKEKEENGEGNRYKKPKTAYT